MQESLCSLKGFLKVDVIDHLGRTVCEGPVIPNLLLDRGLNAMPDVLISDLFSAAMKGSDSAATTAYTERMKESFAATEDYTLGTISGNTCKVTRVATAVARDFVASDVGKLIRSANGKEVIITAIDSVSVVSARGVGVAIPVVFTAQDIALYSVQRTNLSSETVTGTYTLGTISGNTAKVTRASGARNFTSADLGFVIHPAAGVDMVVSKIDSTTVVSVVAPVGVTPAIYTAQAITIKGEFDRTNDYSSISGENSTNTTANARTLKRTFLFPAEHENRTVTFCTATWSGTGFVATSSVFAATDVGSYLKAPSTGEYCKIVTYTNATTVVVDRSPVASHVAVVFDLYGYNSYTHIGFSDSDVASDPINILVWLNDGAGTPAAQPVRPLGSTPETAGQQVKVTYTMIATFGPNTPVTGATALITDSGNAMSSNKAGSYVLENMSSSFIASDGSTDSGSSAMEPATAGEMALSTSSAALVAIGAGTAPSREVGAETNALTADSYTADSFTLLYEGTFAAQDAIGSTWRSMGIFDPVLQLFLFTFLFAANQNKPATHSLTLRFRKSWSRDLS